MELLTFDTLKIDSRSDLRRDLVAGLTVAVMIIPQGMAYALLAGLPAIYGLYAALVPLLIYPIFGSSRRLSVGPVALVSIIVLSGISQFAAPGTAAFVELAILTSFLAGIIQALMSMLRMGFLVNFLSEPVIAGFTAAAAVIITINQVKYLFKIDVDGTSGFFAMLGDIFSNINNSHIPTALIGIGAILTILLLKRIKKSFPAGLVVIIISTGLVYIFRQTFGGVDILEDVKGGLPTFDPSFIKMENIMNVLPLALVICLISFIESLAIAKTIAGKHHHPRIEPNKELFGLGMAKIVGSFFAAYPNTGSFTRSAINDEAGARSGWSSVFTSIFIALILLFFTPLLYYLPKPILAAIVISSVAGLINISYARNIYQLDKKDFLVYLITFILTLAMGVVQGVIAGILLSAILILYKISRPHYAILGKLPGTNSYRNIDRYSQAEVNEDILIIRYDDDIYFGSADHFYDCMINEINKRPKTETMILNAAGISSIDTTGLHKLGLLLDHMDTEDITFQICNVRGKIRDLLAKSGLAERIGLKNNYLTVHDAVTSQHKDEETKIRDWEYLSQKNIKIKS